MKTLRLECACGDSKCSTFITVEVDYEKPSNFILKLKDDIHQLESWYSFDKVSWEELDKFVKSKYGKKEAMKSSK